MKILVFTDVHGSFNSLINLTKTKDFKTADKVIFLGDVCIGCSRPNKCIDLLKNLDCVCLLGNNDSYVSSHIPKADLIEFSNEKLEMIKWMTKNVSKENKDIINSWKKDYYLTINDKKFYFTHYAWENYDNDTNVIDSPKTPNLEVRKVMFKDINAALKCVKDVFFGK